MKENPNSHLTAKERDKVSFPTRKLYNLGVIKGDVLDFGSGFGKDVEFLRKKDLTARRMTHIMRPSILIKNSIPLFVSTF